MKVPVIIALSLSVAVPLFPSLLIKNPEKKVIVRTNTTTFDMLRGHRQGSGISLMWSMSRNSSVIDYRVEATYEDPTDPYSVWINRGTVPNKNGKVQKFNDASVYPGTMYYRVYARLSDNSTICSDICMIRLVSH
jgi:hypothetical protein